MKLVLMGTGEFAVPPFEALLNSHHTVAAVFTQPDRTGRGHHHHTNPIRDLAVSKGIPVFQPERINTPEMLSVLKSFQADAFIVAAYGQILKRELLAIPRLGAFNLHGSVLPRHRGAAPVQYAIWKGDVVTGVTIFRIEASLDSGPIAGIVKTPVGDGETSGELMMRLAHLSVPLTLSVVDQLENGTAVLIPQNPAEVTLAPKIPREAGVINWSGTRREIDCHVRAMQPWPKASSVLHRLNSPPLRCLIRKVDPDARETPGITDSEIGDVTDFHNRLFVSVSDGWLEVLVIQPEGRRELDGRAFLNGHPISPEDHFDTPD